jgi:hypothetical protein
MTAGQAAGYSTPTPTDRVLEAGEVLPRLPELVTIRSACRTTAGNQIHPERYQHAFAPATFLSPHLRLMEERKEAREEGTDDPCPSRIHQGGWYECRWVKDIMDKVNVKVCTTRFGSDIG